MLKPIIFSDIDGTILDPKYKPGLYGKLLKKVDENFELVFVSGRTIDEICYLHDTIDYYNDFIAENGAVIGSYSVNKIIRYKAFKEYVYKDKKIYIIPAAELISSYKNDVIDISLKNKVSNPLLNDLTTEEAAFINTYSIDDAARSLNRFYSLLFKKQNIPEEFINDLKTNNYDVSFSEKWLYVTKNANKGNALDYYFKAFYPDAEKLPETIGIGNADNDGNFIWETDLKFVLKRPDGTYDGKLKSIENVNLLKKPGISGFEEMIELLLNKNKKKKLSK
jgi:HAD superfamily hydrolase (TIGR01484 family)